MLSIEEDDFVYAALVRIAAQAPNPRLAIVVALDPVLQQQLNDGAPMVIVRQAIRLCSDDGYRLAPPSIVNLLRLAEVLEPRITAVIQRVTVSPPRAVPAAAMPNPFMDSVLVWKVPFLERTRARTALQALLAAKPTQPFVVVNGPAKQGKSYTAEFIAHVLQGRNDLNSCLVQLAEKQGAGVGPAELARDLVARLGGVLAAEPPKVTNLDRWYEELVTWVTDAGLRTGYSWWIILDGFNTQELRDDTRAFIGKLAKRFTTAVPQRFFRLILLDFDRTWLPVMPGMISVESTAAIPGAIIKAFIRNIFSGAVPPVDETAVFNDVMEGLADPVTDLSILGQRLTDLIQVAESGA